MKRSGYFAYSRLATDYLIAASMTPGSPDVDDFLDKAQFYLEAAAEYAKLPSEKDYISVLLSAVLTLAERADEASKLFEGLDFEVEESVEE